MCPNLDAYKNKLNPAKKIVKVFVLTRNSEGALDIVDYDISCTNEQYDLGEHYTRAINCASDNGYGYPIGAFDENDPAGQRFLRQRNVDIDAITPVVKVDGETDVIMMVDYTAAQAFVARHGEYGIVPSSVCDLKDALAIWGESDDNITSTRNRRRN